MSNPVEDFDMLVNRALEMPASNNVHQDTIARAKRLAPLIAPQPAAPDAPSRDGHGAPVQP